MKIINLLPKPRQQELRYEAVLHSVWIVFALSLASFALVFLAQVGARFYLQVRAGDLQKQIVDLRNQVKNKENPKVKARVKAENDLVLDYKNLAAATPKWSKVIKAFVPLPPGGMRHLH